MSAEGFSKRTFFLSNSRMNSDFDFMQRALFLAQMEAGHVAPNPLVGAVLVYEDKIIGEGWHQQFGAAHAEVNCINSVSDANKHLIAESTMYVSLEPCAHYGKTPPCAELIIKSNIPKVVIACVDTFSKVSGKGIAMLEAAGIEVVVGIAEADARILNKRFFTFHEKKRPFVILKWAQSKDGFIAPENGKKVLLSNDLAKRYVHKMRQEEAAILVGYQTALLDNPMLTDRLFGGPQPLRVVLDKENNLPDDILLKSDGGSTIVFTLNFEGQTGNCIFVKLDAGKNFESQVLEHLYKRNINSIIIEGGSKTLQAFINEGLWDEAHIIHTPILLGNGVVAPILGDASFEKSIRLADNIVQIYKRNECVFI